MGYRSPSSRVVRFMEAALESLPREYSSALSNVGFSVSRAIMPRERRRLQIGNATLYGHYEGVPLTLRDSSYDRVIPDRITLYWGPLVRDFPEDAELAEEVRKTLYHEIAHYFGMNEDDLHETSVR